MVSSHATLGHSQGMDVVEYYATYGHDARIKLFHCVRVDLTGTNNPYELGLMPKETIQGDFYTISPSGVVQVRSDGSPAEFTPIGEWVREHSVFNMMKQVSLVSSFSPFEVRHIF